MLIKIIKADLTRICTNESWLLIKFISKVFFDPGFLAIFLYRIYSRLYKKNIILKFIAKVLWRTSVSLTGCYLQPQANIKAGFCLPHPIGVIIGEGAIINENVTIYQGVTLGKGSDGKYPSIDSNVLIFPNSILVGGIKVGEFSILGASSFLNKDIEGYQVYGGNPAKFIKKNS